MFKFAVPKAEGGREGKEVRRKQAVQREGKQKEPSKEAGRGRWKRRGKAWRELLQKAQNLREWEGGEWVECTLLTPDYLDLM